MNHNDHDLFLDDGNWYATTLGEFIAFIIDCGLDPAVIFRVVQDGPCDKNGKFVRHIELRLLPDGYVRKEAAKCVGIHKTLGRLLKEGLVK